MAFNYKELDPRYELQLSTDDFKLYSYRSNSVSLNGTYYYIIGKEPSVIEQMKKIINNWPPPGYGTFFSSNFFNV